MIRAALISMAILASGPVAAQGWELHTGDDGSFFIGSISGSGEPGMMLVCGERSPRGLSAAQTGNMEPDITTPRAFRLYLGDAVIGPPTGSPEPRRDVMIVAGTTGYRLASVRWNELFGNWETDLADTDPVFAAMAASPRIELHSLAGMRGLTGTGFGAAFGQLSQYCQAMFASIGKPWYAPAAQSPGTPIDSGPTGPVHQFAETAIALGCNGPAARDPGYLLTGNIDGDGIDDVVLDWGRITCLTSLPRPFCGASMCSAVVFLSAWAGRAGNGEDLLAQGVRLQPLNNGNMGVVTGGSLGICHETGRTPCEFLFYWNGASLVVAP